MKEMKKHASNSTGFFPRTRNESGFTLIELVLATLISALVMGIMSACLSFALRAWESTQKKQPDHSAALVDLLKLQLSEFDPTPIRFEEGPHPLFRGNANTLVFATGHSVKAISGGVPVIARYTYDKSSKVLLYSELPLDPYHPGTIKQFTRAKSTGGEKEKFRSYRVDVADFSLSYGVKDKDQFIEKWEREDVLPNSVLLNWTTWDGRVFGQLLMVNSPFPIETQQAKNLPGLRGGLN